MFKVYEVYVPQTYNDGTDAEVALDAINAYLTEHHGGYTMGAECVGLWVDPWGNEYRDRIRIYNLFLTADEQAERFARFVGEKLHQVCVTVVYPDRRVNLVSTDMLADAA